MWCFVSGWVAGCQRYHRQNMIHILAPAVKLTTLNLTSGLLTASQKIDTHTSSKIFDAQYWYWHAFLLILKRNTAGPHFNWCPRESKEEKKNLFEKSTLNSEMSWVVWHNGCHGFYPARNNWFNLFIAITDSRSAFTAVQWKICILKPHPTAVLWYYGCGPDNRSSLALRSILCSSQWFSDWSTNVSS